MKYYMKTHDNIVVLLGKGKKIPTKEGYSEITESSYDSYIDTLNIIPEKEGYFKTVTLYVDGTYDVTYTLIEEGERT